MPRTRSKLKQAIESGHHLIMMLTHPRQPDTYAAKFLDSTEGSSVARAFDRFAALDSSAQLLRTMPDPVVLLTEQASPTEGPADTLGQAHQDFMAANGLTVDYLVGLNGDVSEQRQEDAQMTWFRRRLVTSHDLRHVLTGYNTSHAGEYCNVCFRFAQTRHWGVAALAVLAALVLLGRGEFRGVWAGVEGFRRGRRAMSLDLFPWELYLDVRLAECRAILGLTPPRHFARQVEPDAYLDDASADRGGPIPAAATVPAAA